MQDMTIFVPYQTIQPLIGQLIKRALSDNQYHILTMTAGNEAVNPLLIRQNVQNRHIQTRGNGELLGNLIITAINRRKIALITHCNMAVTKANLCCRFMLMSNPLAMLPSILAVVDKQAHRAHTLSNRTTTCS